MVRGKSGRSGRTRLGKGAAQGIGVARQRRQKDRGQGKALSRWVLVAALVFGVVLRIQGAAQSPTITNDEGITLLAATGHQGEYARVVKEGLPPYGTWVRSADWRRFVLPEKRLCLGTISDDLAQHDLHPPLYFWLLHVWMLVWGVHPWTGLGLNLIFFVLCGLGIFAIGVLALRDRLGAAVAVFLWSCSPTVGPSAYQFRQYDLLALCTIGFTWLVLRCTSHARPPARWHYVCLGLAGAAGILTHYHFVIALAGGGIYALIRLVRQHPGRLAVGIASIVLGFGAANLCHPIVGHIQAKSTYRGDSSLTPGQRFRKAYNRYRAFIMDDAKMLSKPARRQYVRIFPYVFLGLCGSMAAVAVYRRRKEPAKQVDQESRPGSLIYFLLCYAAGNVGLYMSGVSPPHAMAAKYPCMAWPFLAFLPVLLTGPIPRVRGLVRLLMCGAMALLGAMHIQWDVNAVDRLGDDMVKVPWNRPLVVSDVSRLRLPRLLYRLNDDLPMWVASPEDILSQYDAWSARLAGPVRFLGFDRSGGADATHKKLFGRFGRDFEVQRGKYAVAGYNIMLVLTKK